MNVPLGVCVALAVLAAVACRRDGPGAAAVKGRGSTAGKSDSRTVTPPRAQPEPARLPEVIPTTQDGQVRRGGTVRVHLEADPPHLNPLQDAHDVVDRVVGRMVFDSLVECRGGEVVPALAERWETTPDGSRLVLHLRSGVHWHDDRPFTVVDVQATLEAVLRSTSRVPVMRALLRDVAAIEIAPDRQVRLRLHRPTSFVLRALCEIPMLPESAVRGGAPAFTAFGRAPIGTGPFRFAAWERGKRIRLVRAARAWGPPALVDEVVFEIETDGTRALARTRRGEIDILPRVLDVHYPDQVLPAALGDRIQLYTVSPRRYSFIVVNNRKAPLSDPRLRRALSALWNRAYFAAELHHGLARPIGAPPFGQVPAAELSPRRAIQMLDEAGCVDTNGDGVREVNGQPVRFTMLQPTGSKSFAIEARKYALELRRVGLLLDVLPVDPGTLSLRLHRGDFDLAPARWEGHPDEDPSLLYGDGGAFNMAGYRSDRVEAALADLRMTDDSAARGRLYQRLAEILADEVPVLFLYRYDQALLAPRRLRGLAAPGGELDLRGVHLDTN